MDVFSDNALMFGIVWEVEFFSGLSAGEYSITVSANKNVKIDLLNIVKCPNIVMLCYAVELISKRISVWLQFHTKVWAR